MAARTGTQQQVTVSVMGVLVAGVVLLALAVAFLAGRGGAPAAQAATAPVAAVDEEAVTPRTLTMRGTGEATVVPDQAAFDVTVKVVRDDLETALGDSSGTVATVLERLEGLGIAKADVETTGLQTSPVFERRKDAPSVLSGYRVTQSVTVLVKQIGRAGRAISATVAAGGNAVSVGDIELRVGDPEAGLGEAREAAVAAATAKATQYAEATGQVLGDVETFVEVRPEDYLSRVTGERAYAADVFTTGKSAELQSAAIRSGSSELSVTVEVVWRLA